MLNVHVLAGLPASCPSGKRLLLWLYCVVHVSARDRVIWSNTRTDRINSIFSHTQSPRTENRNRKHPFCLKDVQNSEGALALFPSSIKLFFLTSFCSSCFCCCSCGKRLFKGWTKCFKIYICLFFCEIIPLSLSLGVGGGIGWGHRKLVGILSSHEQNVYKNIRKNQM